jgi:hypothetical protein
VAKDHDDLGLWRCDISQGINQERVGALLNTGDSDQPGLAEEAGACGIEKFPVGIGAGVKIGDL